MLFYVYGWMDGWVSFFFRFCFIEIWELGWMEGLVVI